MSEDNNQREPFIVGLQRDVVRLRAALIALAESLLEHRVMLWVFVIGLLIIELLALIGVLR